MYSSQANNTASSSLDDSLKAIKDGEVPVDVATEDDTMAASSASSSVDGVRVYRVNLSLLPVALTEAVALASLALVAYALRVGWLPVPLTERLFRCDDPDLSWPQRPQAAEDSLAMALLSPAALYAACVALPFVTMVVGELLLAAFSRRGRRVVRAGCVGCKVHQLTRRLLRNTGVYLLGALCTSVTVDVLKHACGAQRPYFLSVCRLNGSCDRGHYRFCQAAHDPHSVAGLRYASMSFPSFHAALMTYAAVYVTAYLHCVARTRSWRLLKPAVCLALGALALLCCASRVALRRSHAADVLAGAAMGAAVAAYLSACAAQRFRERRTARGAVSSGGQPQAGPFYRYVHTGKDAPCSPGPDAFQRDLQKRVTESRRNRQHAQDAARA
ncbi:hypothetical protein HPB49_004416 [Dermacentor silvarum]|uniref:Uncharacterized protein n=1 Tax=Dermacentor silvarum TaxID=543639 RepID=A0ACB8DIB2_DERSI|nr:hypothetical protein HPB49_004416 [Dermacentor silvarum]